MSLPSQVRTHPYPVSILALTLLSACIERRNPPAPARSNATAPTTVPSPRNDDALSTLVRGWLSRTQGAEAYAAGTFARATEHDTQTVRCVRVTPMTASGARRAARVLCAAGDEVLAGEAGFQRYLQLHQFDARLARDAARYLLELRDAMLGFTGRTYVSLRSTAEDGVLTVDAEGTRTTAEGGAPVPARWRVVIESDGTTREDPLPTTAPANNG